MHLRLTPRRPSTRILGLTMLFASAAAQSVPIIVDTANDNLNAGDGLCTLREAIDNANWDDEHTSGDCNSGVAGMDTIQIQAGLPPIILNGTELAIGRSMAIIGPPAGQDISGDGISRVLHLRADLDSAGAPEYRLENLRIHHGFTSAHSAALDDTHCEGRGAGVCAVGYTQTVAPQLVLRNVHIHNSRTTGTHGDGAGLFARVADLTVEKAWFANNKSDQGNGGAAMVAGIGSARFDDVYLSVNEAGVAGGGIHARTLHALTVNRATFIGSIARNQEASALSVEGVDQTFLSNSVITESYNYNAQGSPNASGYAVRVAPYNTASTLFSVSNSWINENGGCALHVVDVPTFISQSTISRNNCVHDGVALRIDDATVEVTASSLINNVSPFAAVSLDGGRLTLQSTTVVGNQAANPGEAGGVRLDDGVLVLRSTILADNAGAEGSFERVGSGARIDATSSLFSDGAAEVNGSNSGNLFQGGAMVGALSDYGCAVTAGDAYINAPAACVQMRALSPNSPAINQGQAHGAAYDQRGLGFARVEGAAADIGAYEYQAPQITIEAVDASKVEGNSGTTAFSFRVRRSGDTRSESWVGWLPEGHGTNQADAGDFPPTTWAGGSVHFAIGDTEAMLSVYVSGDTNPESTEGFAVTLGTPTNGKLGSASSATGEIINDDSFFPSAVLSLTRLEGDRHEGQYFSSAHRFRVTRSQVTSGTCSFQLQVLAGSGPFVPDAADFVGWTPGVAATYVMMPGNTQWDIEVAVAGDSSLEFDETFDLRLQNASGCGIDTSANQVSSTILNDDSSLWIEAVTASAPEGHTGTTAFSMLIERGSSDLNPATVTWTVSGTGANPANAADFSGGVFPSGTVNFAAGQTEMLIVVSVAGDASNEPNEDFRVTLSNPSGGEIYPTEFVNAIIVNDDSVGGDVIFKNSFE